MKCFIDFFMIWNWPTVSALGSALQQRNRGPRDLQSVNKNLQIDKNASIIILKKFLSHRHAEWWQISLPSQAKVGSLLLKLWVCYLQTPPEGDTVVLICVNLCFSLPPTYPKENNLAVHACVPDFRGAAPPGHLSWEATPQSIHRYLLAAAKQGLEHPSSSTQLGSCPWSTRINSLDF